jgi:arginine utilization protein RocB
MDRALLSQKQNGDAFFARQGIDRQVNAAGRVISFGELRRLALETADSHSLEGITALEKSLATSDEPLSATRAVVGALLTATGLEGPLVVVGFSTLHYPRVHTGSHGEAGQNFAERLKQAVAMIEERHNTSIGFRQFFAGISDMSFFGHRPEMAQSETLKDNTPVPAFVDAPPQNALSYPVVNIGPWGRDYHQKWERVHMGYAFDVLPDLITESVLAVL